MAEMAEMDGNGLPWWAKSVLVMGPVALGFIVLLAVFVGWIPSPMADIQTMLRQHVELDRTNIRLLRAICRNTAKTELAVSECNQ